MSVKTYTGSCPASPSASKPISISPPAPASGNCSICTKTRWSAMLHPEAFRLLTDEAALSDYQFGSNSCHWLFCQTCGVRSFGPRLHSRDRRALRLGVALLPGHASPDELMAAPVQYCDGRKQQLVAGAGRDAAPVGPRDAIAR